VPSRASRRRGRRSARGGRARAQEAGIENEPDPVRLILPRRARHGAGARADPRDARDQPAALLPEGCRLLALTGAPDGASPSLPY
jgi:hypothetical protein